MTEGLKCDYGIEDKLKTVRHLVIRGLETDGGHHKQWYLEQIAHELSVDLDLLDYEEGIAP